MQGRRAASLESIVQRHSVEHLQQVHVRQRLCHAELVVVELERQACHACGAAGDTWDGVRNHQAAGFMQVRRGAGRLTFYMRDWFENFPKRMAYDGATGAELWRTPDLALPTGEPPPIASTRTSRYIRSTAVPRR